MHQSLFYVNNFQIDLYIMMVHEHQVKILQQKQVLKLKNKFLLNFFLSIVFFRLQ